MPHELPSGLQGLSATTWLVIVVIIVMQVHYLTKYKDECHTQYHKSCKERNQLVSKLSSSNLPAELRWQYVKIKYLVTESFSAEELHRQVRARGQEEVSCLSRRKLPRVRLQSDLELFDLLILDTATTRNVMSIPGKSVMIFLSSTLSRFPSVSLLTRPGRR